MLIQVGARGRAFCQRLSVALRASIELSAPTLIVKFSIFSEFSPGGISPYKKQPFDTPIKNKMSP